MRKTIISLLTISALLVGFSAVRAQAGCQNIDISRKAGSFTGEVCVDLTAGTLSIDGEAFVVATGKTYTVNADATVTGTVGNYTVEGTLTLSDGTNTKTIDFSFSSPTVITGQTMFLSKAINTTLLQTATTPIAPATSTSPSID